MEPKLTKLCLAAGLGNHRFALHCRFNSTLKPQVSADQPLMEAGLDSLGAVELRNSLATRFDLDLTPTLTFDYPTPKALASYLANSLAQAAARDEASAAVQGNMDEQEGGMFDLEELSREVSSLVMSVLGTHVPPEQVCFDIAAIVVSDWELLCGQVEYNQDICYFRSDNVDSSVIDLVMVTTPNRPSLGWWSFFFGT